MNRLTRIVSLALIASPAAASPEILPLRGMRYAAYDLATGKTSGAQDVLRDGHSVWATGARTGYVLCSSCEDWIVLDWGDAGTPGSGPHVDALAVSYGTGETLPTRLDAIVFFYGEENGSNSAGRVALAGFQLTDLPSGGPGFSGWTISLELGSAGVSFTIDGNDLDADGLVDFGYSYYFPHLASTGQPPLVTGPILADYGPNTLATGADGYFDAFAGSTVDPDATYVGTFWVGAQLYMELFEGNRPACPSPGASGKYCFADIAGDLCVVDLADLAQLLANYGVTSGATRFDGDVNPPPPAGDGDVDLGDLAELLSQYGDDCN